MKYNEELFRVCRSGNKERLNEMLREGVDINQINEFNDNCLFDACRNGHKDIIKILIEEGININQVNERNENCLFYPCLEKNKELIKHLIKNGIEVIDNNITYQDYNIYKSNVIDENIKRYVKELKIKKEIRNEYI